MKKMTAYRKTLGRLRSLGHKRSSHHVVTLRAEVVSDLAAKHGFRACLDHAKSIVEILNVVEDQVFGKFSRPKSNRVKRP